MEGALCKELSLPRPITKSEANCPSSIISESMVIFHIRRGLLIERGWGGQCVSLGEGRTGEPVPWPDGD